MRMKTKIYTTHISHWSWYDNWQYRHNVMLHVVSESSTTHPSYPLLKKIGNVRLMFDWYVDSWTSGYSNMILLGDQNTRHNFNNFMCIITTLNRPAIQQTKWYYCTIIYNVIMESRAMCSSIVQGDIVPDVCYSWYWYKAYLSLCLTHFDLTTPYI